MTFYRICRSSFDDGYYWAEPKPYPSDLEAFVVSPSHPHTDISYNIRTGSRPGDILYFSAYSNRLIGYLRSMSTSGFGIYPISVLRAGKVVNGYHGIHVYGHAGPLDDARNKLVRHNDIIVGYNGVYIDKSQWSGHDLFSIPGFGIQLFLTERIAKQLLSQDLCGVTLVRNDRLKLEAPSLLDHDTHWKSIKDAADLAAKHWEAEHDR